MKDTELAYIAGLFDGEGCVSYKQYMRKRDRNKKAYPTWQIRLEISMTNKPILQNICDILGVGTVTPKRYKIKKAKTWKKQWRWRCSPREAYFVCMALYPYAHIKIDKLQQIIDHYSKKDNKVFNGRVVNLNEYKEAMHAE